MVGLLSLWKFEIIIIVITVSITLSITTASAPLEDAILGKNSSVIDQDNSFIGEDGLIGKDRGNNVKMITTKYDDHNNNSDNNYSDHDYDVTGVVDDSDDRIDSDNNSDRDDHNIPTDNVSSLQLTLKEIRNLTRRITSEEFGKYVKFKYYKNGQLTYIGTGVNSETLSETGCTASEDFAFILHGWKQNCETEWIPLLIGKLTQYRGGCIICIDYGFFAEETYYRLIRQFESLSNLITYKLKYLQSQGFDPNKGYIFGFSFGGQLAIRVGSKFGKGLIKNIDTCDMAGPGFDYKSNLIDYRSAAQNVQCIHTTRDKGTRYYNCHQDWRLGNCGYNQLAAKEPPQGSHGLCPHFYISAFDHDFFAVRNPDNCPSRNPALYWPQNFKMGYMESRKQYVSGELFAQTGPQYPFNVILSDYAQYPVQGEPTVAYKPIIGRLQFFKGRNKSILSSVMKARKLLKRRRI